jgi:hypothetical protein
VTAEDELFVASLAATRDLKLLDLTQLLYEEHVTEFDGLDMAVHMLFLAGPHSYEITRLIAQAAHAVSSAMNSALSSRSVSAGDRTTTRRLTSQTASPDAWRARGGAHPNQPS